MPQIPLRDAAGYAVLCLSPHLDDAVLSCGASLALHRQRGERVLVATFCTADPPPGHRPDRYEAALLARWQLDAATQMALRRSEDAAALAALGVDGLWADLPDAMHRRSAQGTRLARWLGRGRRALAQLRPGSAATAPPDSFALALAAHLGALWRGSPDALILAPLGIGAHPDHLLVHDAARALARLGARVAYYADLPYACSSSACAARLRELPTLREQRVPCGEGLPVQHRALTAYTSQLPVLIGPDAAATLAALRAHAEGLGQGTACEQRWTLA